MDWTGLTRYGPGFGSGWVGPGFDFGELNFLRTRFVGPKNGAKIYDS